MVIRSDPINAYWHNPRSRNEPHLQPTPSLRLVKFPFATFRRKTANSQLLRDCGGAPLPCQEGFGDLFVFGGNIRFAGGLSYDDGPADQGYQGLGESFDVPGANLFQEAGDESFQIGKVTVDKRTDFRFVTLWTKLGECFGEGAAMKIR